MNLLNELKNNNTIINTKGGEYFSTSYNANLDLFTKVSRFNYDDEIIDLFIKARVEDKSLALANLLYLLDIRNGKGERRVFKIIFRYLCLNYKDDALIVLPFISKLGRYDYILEGIDSLIEDEVISLIKKQLNEDLNSDSVSLLGKWLPSLRCHNKNNLLAKRLVKLLGISEKEYRNILKVLRDKINIVESKLTNCDYENINYELVPSKAILKYSEAFNINDKERFTNYKSDVLNSKKSINTKGLYCYEIIRKLINSYNADLEVLDALWKNQKDIDCGDSDTLVVADTSGSMGCYNYLPLSTSIGLAIYFAERNKGLFKNSFITFSNKPVIQEIKGDTIYERFISLKEINESYTDIDKTFELILDTLIKNNGSQFDLPKNILIISDMEFDRGIYSKNSTNFEGWKKAFNSAGFDLPNIIFWNVAGYIKGLPVTSLTDNVSMISGFSQNILENLFTLENYNPINLMLDKLKVYLDLL